MAIACVLSLLLTVSDPPVIRKAGPVEPNALALTRIGPAGKLPPAVDNSRLPGFPAIQAQNLPHACTGAPCRHPGVKDKVFKSEACQSFSIVYYQFSHNTNLERTLAGMAPMAAPFSPRWTHSFAFMGNGAMYTDLYPILARHGAPAWNDFAFTDELEPWCTDPDVWRKALSHRISHAECVENVGSPEGADLVKRLLVNGYVLVIYTYPRSRSWGTFGSDELKGKRVVTHLDGTEGGHAMTLVGYDDRAWVDLNKNGQIEEGERGAYRVADSHGPGQEDQGFLWFSYDSVRSRSAVPEAFPGKRVPAWSLFGGKAYHLVIGDKLDYRPAVLARFTVRHASRGELKVSLGIGGIGAEKPSATWDPYLLQPRPSWTYNSRSFDGTEKETDATFVLDFTDLAGREPTPNRRYFLLLEDTREGRPAMLQDFRVMETRRDREWVYKGGPERIDAGKRSVWVDAD